jgi:membrane fusion protein (multidrug efflux system)
MASKAIYAVVAMAGIALASGAAWWYQKPKAAAAANGSAATASATANGAAGKPVTVEAAQVQVVRLVDDAQAVGSLRSRRSVVLRPEVSGRITQLNFTDGQRVRKGQVLVQFDDQLPLAQVQQSQAELSIAQANQKRNEELVAQNFVSQRSLDESAANLQVAQAKLSLAKATAARLKIVAPFDGIAGIRLVNNGDYLKDGADIVNIEDIDALFVDFRLPERFQSKVKRGQMARVDLDALPGQKYTAVVQAIDPLIDANGRSVAVRACIDNRQLRLRPGMFARVNTVFGQRDNATVIPEEALLPQGDSQFVIKLLPGADAQTWTTQRVPVQVGMRRPGKVEIVGGLQAGDTVITTGQQRIQRDGTKVSVVVLNTPAAASAKSPAPTEAAAAPVAGGANPCLVGMPDLGVAPAQGQRKAAPAPSPGPQESATRPVPRNPA